MSPELEGGVTVYHAGELVRVSGIYAATDGRRATLNRGDRFPPLALPEHWVLVMGTRRQEGSR